MSILKEIWEIYFSLFLKILDYLDYLCDIIGSAEQELGTFLLEPSRIYWTLTALLWWIVYLILLSWTSSDRRYSLKWSTNITAIICLAYATSYNLDSYRELKQKEIMKYEGMK